MMYGDSSEVLPGLDWSIRTIAWLDYDYRLNKSVLSDVKRLCLDAIPGSMFVVTVDAKPAKLEYLPKKDPAGAIADHWYKELVKGVGSSKVPRDVDPRSLGDWGTAEVYWRIINNEIETALTVRNFGKPPGNKILYKQLFHFRYADGARMLTVGGLLYEEGQAGIVDSCEFDKLDFVSNGKEPIEIHVPCLTLREIRDLDKQLPLQPGKELEADSIPKVDLDAYKNVYRFYPAFAETEL